MARFKKTQSEIILLNFLFNELLPRLLYGKKTVKT